MCYGFRDFGWFSLGMVVVGQIELAKMLVEMGQSHLFDHWAEPGFDDEEKKGFFDQVWFFSLLMMLKFWIRYIFRFFLCDLSQNCVLLVYFCLLDLYLKLSLCEMFWN